MKQICILFALLVLIVSSMCLAEENRARNLGVPFDGNPGRAIVATDAPLLPHQLKRLARRASLD